MNTPRFYDGPVDGARLADALLKIDRDILRYRAGRAAEADAETQRRETALAAEEQRLSSRAAA